MPGAACEVWLIGEWIGDVCVVLERPVEAPVDAGDGREGADGAARELFAVHNVRLRSFTYIWVGRVKVDR